MFCVSFFPSSARAQLTNESDRCLPQDSYARAAAALHNQMATNRVLPGTPPGVVIDRVVFDGPISLPQSDLKALVAKLRALPISGEGNWLEELQDEEIIGLWKDRGYFKANVVAKADTLSTANAQQHVALHIQIEEGRQYRLGAITYRSADPAEPLVFPVTVLMKQFTLHEGDIFAASKIRATLDHLNLLYASDGYIDFVTTPITEINEETHRVDLIMELDQQMQYRIATIQILTTNRKFRAIAESQLKTGDVYNHAAILRLLRENATLLPPGISETDVSLRRDTENATVNLRLELEPCPPPQN